MSEQPRATIIVTAWRDAPFLEACLRSLNENSDERVSSEVIVVLNEPTDRAQTTAVAAGAKVEASAVNMGFAGACNRGAGLARGEFVVFLNDDTEVEPGWLAELVAAADAHPDAGAIGSRILYFDGRIQEAGVILWSDGTTTSVGRGEPDDPDRYSTIRAVDYCSASSLLVRRAAWEQVGGMDEYFYPAYFEDADLCFKLRRLGYRVLYAPRSRVLHHEAVSSDPLFKTFVFFRNRELFVAKWDEVLQRHDPPAPDVPGAIERAIEQAARVETTAVTPSPAEIKPGSVAGEGDAGEPELREARRQVAYLRRELELKDAFLKDVRGIDSAGYRLVARVKRTLLRYPRAYRFVSRLLARRSR